MLTQLQILLFCTAITPIFGIFGGKTAELGQFPHVASLRLNNFHFCSGSIISEKFILTSAYCKSRGSIELITAVVGTIHQVNGGDHYNIVKYLNHENWTQASLLNDIAIVEVKTPIRFNKFVQPIRLPTKLFDDKGIATVSGFGTVSYPNVPSKYLMWVDQRILGLERCRIANAPVIVYDSQICSHPDAGQGICEGDIGGALVMDGTLIGIASKSTYYCGSGLHDFYTNVYFYLDWVTNNSN
ncbi:PREDICTED: chymotrypsin-1-like [Nicrophorus vespilloides]|uniref:Chymotrypsin-1-like n=1 Tax=Nicrophorus vespilloides TaxID=110193 RepID=A0ABM1MCQ4_NICVS|nr:PREDICTED: chymotrypsin-1-like [Nicrophorus vespilloides]